MIKDRFDVAVVVVVRRGSRTGDDARSSRVVRAERATRAHHEIERHRAIVSGRLRVAGAVTRATCGALCARVVVVVVATRAENARRASEQKSKRRSDF